MTSDEALEERAPNRDEEKSAAPPKSALEALGALERKDDLARLARGVLARMHESKRAAPDRSATETEAKDLELERAACATPFGNALDVLSRGPEDDAENELAGALAALAVGLADPADASAGKLGARLVWLTAHTAFDALAFLDELPPAKRPWRAIAEAASSGALDRAERLVAWSALARSEDEVAKRAATAASDPLLAPAPSVGPLTFEGRVASAPRAAWSTALLAVTGVLFVVGAARLFARFILSYETPGTVEVGARSITVRWEVRLLGRTLRERESILPREGLLAVTREVRYPSLQLYAGLLMLALGSWFGMSLVVDGARAWSSSLLAVGALIVAVGVAIDFALTSAIPGARGTCRVLLSPRRGRALAIERVDPKRADEALARIR